MYKEIYLKLADGGEKAFPFLANASTAIRFKMTFRKELSDSIANIVKAAGIEKIAYIAAISGQEKEAVDLGKVDAETLSVFISIAGSGELQTISELAYIMNQAALKADMTRLSVEGYLDWLDQFESLEFLNHIADFIGIYSGNRITSSDVKKKRDQQSGE